MPEWRRSPASAAGVPRKLYFLGNAAPRSEIAHSRLPNAMSAPRNAAPALSHGQRGPPAAMAAPGASPRLMSPTLASRSGRTGIVTGAVALPLTARARSETRPGRATTRPSTRNRPSSSERVSPALRQPPPPVRVSSTTVASGRVPAPRSAMEPPGATARSDGVAERPPRPAIDEPEDRSTGIWNSAAKPTTPRAISAATRRSAGCGR